MKLSELLVPDLVVVPMEADDKWQAIAELARVPARAGKYADSFVATVEQALTARERSMTTGMQHGIAIPHAAVDGIDELVAVLALSSRGIPFDTLDGRPAQILVCLIIPRAKKLLHIKTLAEIARLLSRPEVRQRLSQCESAREVVDALEAMERPAA
ncbi:MAG: EIIABC-Fru [Planctomycetota bacterium]|jgi:mannitol/fructose-specific phosphotransferase system IIA component (Ntr-type)